MWNVYGLPWRCPTTPLSVRPRELPGRVQWVELFAMDFIWYSFFSGICSLFNQKAQRFVMWWLDIIAPASLIRKMWNAHLWKNEKMQLRLFMCKLKKRKNMFYLLYPRIFSYIVIKIYLWSTHTNLLEHNAFFWVFGEILNDVHWTWVTNLFTLHLYEIWFNGECYQWTSDLFKVIPHQVHPISP